MTGNAQAAVNALETAVTATSNIRSQAESMVAAANLATSEQISIGQKVDLRMADIGLALSAISEKIDPS